jgi:redox-sensitive bicupin YhaK (pirin superfamily)
LIAGEAFGLTNEVKTKSPLFYAHVVLQPGTRFSLPQGHSERGAYVAKGSVEVNGHTYSVGQLLVFTSGVDPVITAIDTCTLMVLGGEPLGERFIWWNFVSSRRERIEQAKADWQAGRIPLPPNDNAEFVALPEDHSKPAGSSTGSPPPQALS